MILSPVCDNMMINCGKSAKIAVLEPGTAVFALLCLLHILGVSAWYTQRKR